MLAELIIGDSYGTGFEGGGRALTRTCNHAKTYVTQAHQKVLPGHYSARGQGALVIAELMIGGQSWTRHLLADELIKAFKRDRRSGFNESFASLCGCAEDGKDFLKKMIPMKLDAEAAVRACPLGILPRLADIMDGSRHQAKLTHDMEESVAAAIAAAKMVHYALYDKGPIGEVDVFVGQFLPGVFQVPWDGVPTESAVHVLSAAMTAFGRNNSMMKLLRDCVDVGGPTGCTAAIALAAGSVSCRYKQDLPQTLFEKLERGEYGAEYIAGLDEQFMKIIPR